MSELLLISNKQQNVAQGYFRTGTRECMGLLNGSSVNREVQALFCERLRLQCLGLLTQSGVGGAIALLLYFSTITVNQENINYLMNREGFSFTVTKNAILHPPAIKTQLNQNSIIVVEDSILHNSYALGNSGYTFLSLGYFDYNAFQALQRLSFIKYQPIYNGTLFKWAYLMPKLQEEVYPFSVEHMEAVPDAILYNWIQHNDNIYCLGYDKNGNWHDKTALFKKKIMQEKIGVL